MGCVSEDDEKPYNRHCQVAPLVQVFSVRLDTHFKDKTPYCIYGKINVIEVGDGTTFTLYERETHDPEVLQKNNAILSLTGPMLGESPGFISQSRGGAIMQLALRDSVRDVEVVGGQCSLGSIIEYEDHHYDKLRTAVLKCLHGCAKVYYATVLYGVMSKIQLKFLIDGDYGRDLPSDLHLIVTAHYGNSKLYPTHNEDSNYFEMLLLKRPLHGLEQTNTSELICQHAVVVPAYSSLIVEANLVSSSGKGFCGSVEFPATYHGCYVHKIRVLNGLVRVQVAWDFINPYHRLC
ncbi:uncharacterized protein LOC110684133 [Chenopodium quinoa]|uniref:uncharacterized protein LOC110684133 n=1 Tax=Chenopodium quinoa TaxID=63459 RepID=UPI000B77F566|nr:uncharacterized protein LOC110684133 [Chenopodium quinoa]XP_021716234.1 uncharacterized protein LOC110684133 [Chenopodium quinoa]